MKPKAKCGIHEFKTYCPKCFHTLLFFTAPRKLEAGNEKYFLIESLASPGDSEKYQGYTKRGIYSRVQWPHPLFKINQRGNLTWK